jgi:hypothetical protein
MTVADNTSRNQYTATSGQTVFAYTFEIVDKDDIVVLKNGTTLSEGTDYTVSNVGNENGGNVTLTVGAATSDILTLYRDMPYSRTQNYTNSGDFLASDVNSDFDNLWLAGEQTSRSFSQSIRKPITDSDSISMELPEAADRAGRFLTFDSAGAVSTVSQYNPTANITRQQFTGDGSTTAFSLSEAPDGAGVGVQIYIDGVYQEDATYSITSTILTFTEAPPLNASIEVVEFETFDIGTATASNVTIADAGGYYTSSTVEGALQEIQGGGGGGGTGLQSRTNTSVSTGSIADDATSNQTVSIGPTYAILKIQTNFAAWVRVYTDTTSRTNDASRLITDDPTPDAGVLAEVISTGAETIKLSPAAIGWTDDASNTVPLAITNKSGASADVTVTLTTVQLED